MNFTQLKAPQLAAVLVLVTALVLILFESFSHTALTLAGVPGDPGIYLLAFAFALFTGQSFATNEPSAFEAKWVELADAFKPILTSFTRVAAPLAGQPPTPPVTPAPTATEPEPSPTVM